MDVGNSVLLVNDNEVLTKSGEVTVLPKGSVGTVVEKVTGYLISVSWKGLTEGHNNGKGDKWTPPYGNDSCWMVPEEALEVVHG